MPLMPAIRPVSSISRTEERPISAPPIAADKGVKFAMTPFRSSRETRNIDPSRAIAMRARDLNARAPCDTA